MSQLNIRSSWLQIPSIPSPWFSAPAIIFVAVFSIYPLLNFAAKSFTNASGFTLDNYIELFTNEYFSSVLIRTIGTALLVSCICLVIGYPIAFLIHRSVGRNKLILISLVI